jgi:hypothetical protein
VLRFGAHFHHPNDVQGVAMPTPRLGLPYIAQGQAQKEVTFNEALLRLDPLVQLSAKTRSLVTPPPTPLNGDCYIVPSGATGAWVGQTDRIASWRESAWAFFAPASGWRVALDDERTVLTFADGAWRDRLIGTANGGGIRLIAIEQELTLTGAFVETTGAAIIADRMIVLGVASRTTLAISGATSYSVGTGATPGQFGASLGFALGSSNLGMIGPTAFYAATPIRVTAVGGSFTGGKVRLALYALAFASLTS